MRSCGPLLFSIAYQMVGSISDAEDIVQEAFLRFHREASRGTDIASSKAWLSTVTTRLAINHVQAARAPGALCRHLAARAAGDRDGVGGPAACRDGRLAVAGVPGPAGEPRPGRAGGVFAVGGVRLRLRRDRGRGRQEPDNCRQIAVRAAGRSRRRSRALRPHAANARSSRSVSSTPSRPTTLRDWSDSSPPAWSSTPTAAARLPR
jgi:hypothetical protein